MQVDLKIIGILDIQIGISSRTTFSELQVMFVQTSRMSSKAGLGGCRKFRLQPGLQLVATEGRPVTT